ncbi:Hypothetical protein GLP15_4731 [Giardia lamblia P15]|uniref:Uncharacterized protein n=1 Tax=Giardia intestinalis (strain P15) TaxID=658858 RepID=E1F1M7_GIAIA|nr:Hypothetical protein GLP15_4731 [Giardia lamblia P15]
MRTTLSRSVTESPSTGYHASGTYPEPRKAMSGTFLTQGNVFRVEPNSIDDIKESLTKATHDLSVIAAQVLDLYGQNKSFLQVLSTNNLQLEAISSAIRSTESLLSQLHTNVHKLVPAQHTSHGLGIVRSASLPVSSRCKALGSFRTDNSSSPQCDPVANDLVQGMTPKSNDTALRTASASPLDISHVLHPLATALSSQRPGSPEQNETAAVLAASAAAQVMAEQRGSEDFDTVFYNKVLTKLLSPQPNILGGNWNINVSRQAASIADLATEKYTRQSSKKMHSLTASPRSSSITGYGNIASSNPDLGPTMYPISSCNHQGSSSVMLKELVPALQAVETESPAGPGATLIFRCSNETFSQRDRSVKTCLSETEEYVKIPTLSDTALQTARNRTSPTTIHVSDFPSEHDKVDSEIADKPEHYDSSSETRDTHAIDLTNADFDLDSHTPVTISQPRSPHIFSDELQTLVAVVEPHAVVLHSDHNPISTSTEKSKTQEVDRIPTATRHNATKRGAGSRHTPRPRSAPKSKPKAKSQPSSRSGSRRGSINRQSSVVIASPSARFSKPSPSRTQVRTQVKPIAISAYPDSKYSTMSQASAFNVSSDIHLGSAGPSSMASMSLSTIGTRPGARHFSRSSSLPLSNTTSRTKSDRARLNMILEKYSEASDMPPATKEHSGNLSQDPLEYKKVFTSVISFMHFFLDHSNCDPFSPLPTDDLLTKYASVLCEKMQRVQLDTVGKHLILTAEWMVEQFTSEHFFDYITTQSFIAEHFTHFPKTLSEVSLEISADNKRRKEEYDRRITEYEIERKKGSPRSKHPEKPEEPKRHTIEHFHTAFKRCLRNLWGPELERELIYYFHEKYMDMTATEGIILQEATDFIENPKKSLFPGHNLYNYAELFNKYKKHSSSLTPDEGDTDQCVAYNLYFYYCLLSIYLLLNDCLPIRFNIYFMNYKTFQGVFRYISPADLEKPMSMSSNFRLYWPAWKDVRRGTLRLHCKFVEVKRDERPSRLP